jgi:hypothetical protein
MTIWLLTSLALAADEPCTGHVFEDRVSSEHFWVEWEPEILTEDQALAIADYAEQARSVYVDELGWPMTEEAIVYAVRASEGSGIGGLAQTETCDGVPVPQITLYLGEYSDSRALNVTAHELGHAAEYGYMSDYLDSVSSWLWWMEGSATWLAAQVDGDLALWASDVDGYMVSPQLGLHQGLSAFLYADRTNHMYGTAVIARYLQEQHGGAEVVRETWAYGGPLSGEKIYFPDALAAAGLDFDAVWAEWAARLPTVDLGWGVSLSQGPTLLTQVSELPASGEPEEDAQPQGLGFNIVSFEGGGQGRNQALSVVFDGDSSVAWTVVLVRAIETSPGSPVLGYVPLDVDENGHAEGWLSDFNNGVTGFLVVSPHSENRDERAWSWSAESIDDPGEMGATVTLNADPEGCGCASGGHSGAGFLGGLLALCGVRRRRFAAQGR